MMVLAKGCTIELAACGTRDAAVLGRSTSGAKNCCRAGRPSAEMPNSVPCGALPAVIGDTGRVLRSGVEHLARAVEAWLGVHEYDADA